MLLAAYILVSKILSKEDMAAMLSRIPPGIDDSNYELVNLRNKREYLDRVQVGKLIGICTFVHTNWRQIFRKQQKLRSFSLFLNLERSGESGYHIQKHKMCLIVCDIALTITVGEIDYYQVIYDNNNNGDF